VSTAKAEVEDYFLSKYGLDSDSA